MDYTEIIKLLSPIFVGFMSAYFGSLLALNKFKKEKFWDERRSGYRSVIEAFEELDHWSEIVRAESCCEPSSSIESKSEEALRVIAKYSKTGNLLFSNEFQQELESAYNNIRRSEFEIHNESLGDMETERQRMEWQAIHANEVRALVSKSLPKLIGLAKDELPKKT